jgi:hypothetical protein
MQPRDVRANIRGMLHPRARTSAARERSRWKLALIAALLGGCSAMVNTDLGPPPLACDIGDVNACLCADGSDGVQRCNAGGSFDDCRNSRGSVCDSEGAAGRRGSGD